MKLITDDQARLLSTNKGLKILLTQNKIDIDKAIKSITYQKKLRTLQISLLQLQEWVYTHKKK